MVVVTLVAMPMAAIILIGCCQNNKIGVPLAINMVIVMVAAMVFGVHWID